MTPIEEAGAMVGDRVSKRYREFAGRHGRNVHP